MERYSKKLYWHIRRLVILHEDADDALQNTFINAWRNIGEFRNESAIYTWLYKIATNEALSLINKRKRNNTVPLEDMESYFQSSAEGSTWFDGDAAEIKLQNAILSLPDKQRIVFNLKYFDEMTYEDMSKVLNTSEGALKASYHHAVKKIEKKTDGGLNFSEKTTSKITMTQPEKISRNNPFKVPENYFEDLNRKIIEETSGKTATEHKGTRKFYPYLLAAASVAVIAVLSYTVSEYLIKSNRQTEMNYSEILSDPSLYEIELYTIEETAEVPDLTDRLQEIKKSEIVDYLLLENIDTEEIIEKL